MSAAQEERITSALSSPDEARDVRALVVEENLFFHKWIGTRMELDPDQLRGQKSGSKQTKASAGASGSTATPLPTRKRAATSPKKPAGSKIEVAPPPLPSQEAENEEEASESPEEPLRRRKRSRTESAAAPEVRPPAAPQAPEVAETTLGGIPFGEAARQVLSDAADIFSEQPPAPSPPANLARDPLLSVEDFVMEPTDPSPSGAAPTPDRATPAGPSTQFAPGTRPTVPIEIDDGKQLLYARLF